MPFCRSRTTAVFAVIGAWRISAARSGKIREKEHAAGNGTLFQEAICQRGFHQKMKSPNQSRLVLCRVTAAF